jgi:fatty-acyl-CoA synthase
MSQAGHGVRPAHHTPLPAMTIGDYLAAIAARGPRPEKARADGGPRLTYAELALDVERVACGLLAVGVEQADRIAIWAHHSAEWTLIELAAARAGAVLVILDGEWSKALLGAALRETQPRLLAADGFERLAALDAARCEASPAGRLVALGTQPSAGRDDLTWAELLVAGSAIDPARLAERESVLDPDDPASIEYEQLAGGELQATTVTHRDYLGGNAFGMVAGKEQDR